MPRSWAACTPRSMPKPGTNRFPRRYPRRRPGAHRHRCPVLWTRDRVFSLRHRHARTRLVARHRSIRCRDCRLFHVVPKETSPKLLLARSPSFARPAAPSLAAAKAERRYTDCLETGHTPFKMRDAAKRFFFRVGTRAKIQAGRVGVSEEAVPIGQPPPLAARCERQSDRPLPSAHGL